MKRLALIAIAGCGLLASTASSASAITVAPAKPCAAETSAYTAAVTDRAAAEANSIAKRAVYRDASAAYYADRNAETKAAMDAALAAYNTARAAFEQEKADTTAAANARKACLAGIGKSPTQVTCETAGGQYNGTVEPSQFFQTNNLFNCTGFGADNAATQAAARALQPACIALNGQIAVVNGITYWGQPDNYQATCLQIN